MRKATDNIIFKYYNTLLHLKSAKKFVKDLTLLNDCLENYSFTYAENLLKKLIVKYKKFINEFGQKYTGIVTVTSPTIYQEKTDDDLIFDLLYLQRLIIIYGAIYVGIEKDIDSAIENINKDNINIKAFDLYDVN